ncbi:hypothetical protein CcI49_28650 [Frankia sp. CcI49]|uniref:TetR/AcrR family transcriptional regulator n=1 Tax=Frankia sp. CcI49 TaxID=1745382 RepID=UPI0009760564|nr:TetR/AcrR family transcriptional regulator [Frankia sp. CcI49]ONH55491.1 hypothetical protein CcI49_28650 [Frankia sp. CcI49]
MATSETQGRKRRGEYRAGRDTRESLMVAAERLFAEHGLDAVSLREIAVEAGSRNSGAAQYYFGSKAELLRAVLEFRSQALNRRRRQLLEAAGECPDVYALLVALVVPLAEMVGHTHYVSFLARLQAEYARDRRSINAGGEVDTSFRRAQTLLAAALPQLPPERFRLRFRLVMRMAIATLGEHERHPDGERLGTSALIEEIIDAAAGLMLAPSGQAGTES